MTDGSVRSLAEIENTLRATDMSGWPALNISVLRNVVVETIEPYYRDLAREIGYRADVQFGAYDQVFQESVGGRADLLNVSTACVVMFTDLDVLSPDLSRNFAGLSPGQVSAEVDRITEFIAQTAAGIRRQSPALILWHGFMTPLAPALGIADAQRADGQIGIVALLNERLRASLEPVRSAYVVDMNVCRARLGADAFYDHRYWHIGRAPYSRGALREIAAEDFKFVRVIAGRQRKCLVLDCDDVLWGGVVGEDGVSGLKLGPVYPGSPYLEFQQEVVNLHNRGVIIALCSKNNEADVLEVFRSHPYMRLREEHIAAFRINWQDKVENLREIAAELNIGLESFVFMDDSQTECELVRHLLPEVEVVHLPREGAVQHRDRLAAGGWFDSLTVSDEDRRRGLAYKAEAARHRLRSSSTDLDGYYRSLEMVVRIQPAGPSRIPRVAQLTQKTNQFNLTTRRYTDDEIATLASNPSVDVLGLRLSDRFGDAGLVGVAIVRYEGPRAVIDTFLLSCRVLGRGVERALLTDCLARAKRRGAQAAIGRFIRTAKNQVAANFYSSCGFVRDPSDDSAWTQSLGDWSGAAPDFFKAIETAEQAEA